MPVLLWWILMLGGIATTVAAAALSAEVEFEAAIALGGLLSTLLGAVGLLLSRVAGDAPRDLRPPGATSRVNLPTVQAPAATGARPTRSWALARRKRRSRRRATRCAAHPGLAPRAAVVHARLCSSQPSSAAPSGT